MGREASCHCTWGKESGICKVLLEPPDIILRGSLRLKAPINSLKNIRAEGNALHFETNGHSVKIDLGNTQSERWAKALVTPGPTLASKLGINPETKIHIIGEYEDRGLEEAISAGTLTEARKADQLVAVVHDADALRKAFDLWSRCPQQPVIWIVYTKGPNQPIGESEIRGTMRENGLIDTKVASVSSVLTALRFVHRK